MPGRCASADGSEGDVIWLAVPAFERGEFVGNYLAAISLSTAIERLVPTWFRQAHRLQLMDNQQDRRDTAADAVSYRSQLNLAGTDLSIRVTPLDARPASVPRAFFGVALLFLLGMLASLVAPCGATSSSASGSSRSCSRRWRCAARWKTR